MNKELSEIFTGFKRTLQLLHKQEKITLIMAVVLMLVNGFLTNLPALILGKLVDTMITTAKFQFTNAVPYLLSIVVIILVREGLVVIRKYLVENIATQTEKRQTVQVVSHLLKADLSVLGKNQIGSLHGRIFRSIEGLVRMIKLGFLEFFPTFFSAFFALVIALSQKPLIASVMILVIPIGIFIIIKQISSQKGIRVSLIRAKEQIDGTLVEMLGGIETVRALNTTDQEIEKIESISEEMRKKEIRHHIFMALFDAVKYLNEGFFYILTITLSILFSAQGIISRGDILVYSILFLGITAPLREIHRILDQSHEGSILVNDLYDLLQEPKDPSFSPISAKDTKKEMKGFIVEIKNLSFNYPNHKQAILQQINLAIKKGEKIGIAGSSGCGKSTLIHILLKLVHNYEGYIYIFGKNLQSVTREEIANKIAYVPQKTYIFYGTLRENIIYGSAKKVTDKEIINATRKANINKEIAEMLGGLDGKVAENGNNLSGGQKQRLAIARLILKSPEMLIFDEATSALDNTNEAMIQRNIESLFKDKTMITIAHRLSTLTRMDRILVMDKGQIVQEGTFTQLSEQKGLFQDFLKQKENLS